MTADEILDREYLTVRAKILEIAAALDRINRGDSLLENQQKNEQLHLGLKILSRSGDDRAEQVQLLFSRKYSENWKQDFGLMN